MFLTSIEKRLRCWMSIAVLLGAMIMSQLPSMAATPVVLTESGVYEEDFSTYARKDYASHTVWDVWARELRLSQPDGINQYTPDVAIHPLDGSIFVVWLQSAGDGNYDIYAQHLDTDGNRLWPEDQRVNSEPESPDRWATPAVSIDTVGNFVVVWKDYRGDDADIYIQKLDGNGNRMWSTDKRVNSDAGGAWQGNPAVTIDASGVAVVVWEDSRNGSSEIYAQRITPAGDRVWTSDMRVHTNLDIAWPNSPTVVADATGNVVVVWLGEDSTHQHGDIYAQKLDVEGERLWATDLKVNANSGALDYESDPAAASDDAGNVMIVWQDYRDSSSGTIYSQQIDVNGSRQWINDLSVSANSVPTTGASPDIAADGHGYFQIVWQSSSRLYAQRIDSEGIPQWSTDRCLVWDGEDLAVVMDVDGDAVIVWREGDLNGDGNIHIARNDAEGQLRWPSVQVNVASGAARQEFPAVAMDSDGNVVAAWLDRRRSDDSVAIYVQRIDVAGNRLWTTDVRVSSDIGFPTKWPAPAVAIDNTGNAFVVWNDYRYGRWVVCVQKIDSAGNRIWTQEMHITSDIGKPAYPVIATDSWGSAVVAWQDSRNGNDDIYAQRIDTHGNRVWEADVRVNSDSGTAPQTTPTIAMDRSGQAVIAWRDQRDDTSIYAQRLDAAGTKVWADDRRVSAYVEPAMQASPAVAVDPDDNAIVVWRELRIGADLYAQKLTPEGVRMWNADLQVNSGSGYVYLPVMAIDDGGNAWVIWEDDRNGHLGSNDDIYGQRISPEGGRLWAEDLKINSDGGVAGQGSPALAVGDGAYTVVVWQDERNGQGDIYAQRLDQGGKAWPADVQVVYPDLFYLPIGSVQSRTVDTLAADITQATLTVDMTLNGGGVQFSLTNDGGVTWAKVTPGVTHVFTTTGSDLRWRAVLTSDPVWRHRSPVVNALRIEYSSGSVGGDDYEPDDSCAQASPIQVNGTVQRRTFHQYQDSDWVWFDGQVGSAYVIQTSNTGPRADTVLELYDACGVPPTDEEDNAFGPGATLTFTAPATGRYYARVLQHDGSIYGADTDYDLSVRTQQPTGAAIIVAGREKPNDPLQPVIEATTDWAYQALLQGGLAPENILYLSAATGKSEVDGTPTKANVRDAIQDWARSRVGLGAPLWLYLADHGNVDRFHNEVGELVTAAELNLWLSNLEATSGVDQVNVIIDACFSGSFIDTYQRGTWGPAEITGHGRTVVASTTPRWWAYAPRAVPGQPVPLMYFSDGFWRALGQGHSLWNAFLAGRATVQAGGQRCGDYDYVCQRPWLDDTGDAWFDASDGVVAQTRGLHASLGAGSAPTIDWLTVSELSAGQATVRAQVRDDSEVTRVWGRIFAPSFTPPESADGIIPVIDVPEIALTRESGDVFAVEYTGFIEAGTYQVVLYAQDDEGHTSMPRWVLVGAQKVYLPLVLRGK